MRPLAKDELGRWKEFARFHEAQASRYRNELFSLLENGELIPQTRLEAFEPYLQDHLIDAIHLSRTPLAQFFTPEGDHDFNRLILWLESNGSYVGP